jgi:hypothetical protein
MTTDVWVVVAKDTGSMVADGLVEPGVDGVPGRVGTVPGTEGVEDGEAVFCREVWVED